MIYVSEIVAAFVGYMFGCFNTGYYLVRFRTGKDIRNFGSKSTGSSNVGRLLGVPGFVITFLGDFAKGAIAVGVALYFKIKPWGVMLVLVTVVIGHIWPVQLHFRGGKGIATACGALLVFDYQVAIVLIVLAGLTWALVRRFTLSGLIVIILSPVVTAVIVRPLSNVLGITVLTLVILVAHRTNNLDIFRMARDKTEEKAIKPPDSG